MRANKYAGECHYCRGEVPAGAGLLTRSSRTGRWQVQHQPATWAGSPVSGHYVGGCPGEADKLNGQEAS